jgi:hypothetical protein
VRRHDMLRSFLQRQALAATKHCGSTMLLGLFFHRGHLLDGSPPSTPYLPLGTV